MHRSRAVLLSLSAAIVALTTTGAQPPSERPCSGPEYRQFDFWVGEWTVERPDGRPAGTNRIEQIEDGCGLQETWTASSGGGTGRSLNTYSPQDGKWHQAWLGNDGLWLHLTGGLRDGRMVLEGQTIGGDKQITHHRITWTPRSDGRVRQPGSNRRTVDGRGQSHSTVCTR